MCKFLSIRNLAAGPLDATHSNRWMCGVPPSWAGGRRHCKTVTAPALAYPDVLFCIARVMDIAMGEARLLLTSLTVFRLLANYDLPLS